MTAIRLRDSLRGEPTRKLPHRERPHTVRARMLSLRQITPLLSLAILLSLALASRAADQSRNPAQPRRKLWTRRNEPMVEVTKVCPTIFYELRYATARNSTGKAIYPPGARCLVRQGVAGCLKQAQAELRKKGLGLKIWDAYRPAWAHAVLWKSVPDPEHVASPDHGGSWHTWGASVDVTLVDLNGREQKMPSDFDDFSPAAKSDYQGCDATVAANVGALRSAMKNAGFRGLRDEWWHFTAQEANQFSPVKMPLAKGGKQ
jgi:D-alanyl-D-alanine dipeptidase